MKLIITFIIILLVNISSAQYIHYEYDPAGNRTNRIFVPPRLANPAKDSLVANNLGIKVFPNPVAESITVNIDELENGESAVVNLSDNTGKILSTKNQSAKQELFELPKLSSGTYFITIYMRSKSISFRIEKL